MIRNDSDYWRAVGEMEALLDLDPQLGTPECDRLIALCDMVEDYDRKRAEFHPSPAPEIDAFMRDQQHPPD